MDNKNLKIKRKLVTFFLLIVFGIIIMKLSPIFIQLANEERSRNIL